MKALSFKMSTLIALFLLLFSGGAFAQFNIRGKISDALSGNPISGANIILNKQPFTSSDSAGYFSLSFPKLPAKVEISHISYSVSSFEIIKLPEGVVNIRLVPKTRELDEVVIAGKSRMQYFESGSFYVLDYGLQDNRIWVSGYANKNVLKPEIRLIDPRGDLLDQIPVRNKDFIYQDPTGAILLIRPDSVYQLFYNGKSIDLIYPNKRDDVFETLLNMRIIRGDTVVISSFNATRTLCMFLKINLADETKDTLFTSFDREVFKSSAAADNYSYGSIPLCEIFPADMGRYSNPEDTPQKLRKNDPKYANMSDNAIREAESHQMQRRGGRDFGSEATRSSRKSFTNYAFDRTIIKKPVTTSVYFSTGLYWIFEDTNMLLWRVKPDHSVQDVLDVRLNPEAKEFKMIQDPADASLYISYQINGSGFVSRLDPITGEVSKTRHLSGFPFAQNIKVNNGKIYFTCSLRADQSSINLYSINFE